MPGSSTFRLLGWLSALISGLGLILRPTDSILLLTAGGLLAVRSLVVGWRATRDTALRPVVVWAALALAIGFVSLGVGYAESVESGRPWMGHLTYLLTLAALASVLTVLNARTPGNGAWAILMALLLLVFLIPWLEGPGLGRGSNALARLRLDQPWSLFYGLLILAGVTNFLPTRFGWPALLLGIALCLEYVALRPWGWSKATLAQTWPWVTNLLILALCESGYHAERSGSGTSRLEALWLWFRDHWGVVWALRIQERFNRTAIAQGWPFQLTWQGVRAEGGTAEAVPPEAESLLIGLLRRFALSSRLEEVAGSGR